MKRILSSPIAQINVLLLGSLIIIGVLHNQYHHDMEKDADSFVFQWCRANPDECQRFLDQ